MNKYKPEGLLTKDYKNYEYTLNNEGLYKAYEEGAILEAPAVLCDHELNLHVEVAGGIGIIPRSEVSLSKDGEEIKDIAILTRVGKNVCFKVIGFDRNEKGQLRPILSRRAAQSECLENYVRNLIPGDVIPARVTHVENFGAFVDIGCGIISLLSIDCISVSRISHPIERIGPSDKIYTVVKSIDEKGRVYVSMRELLGNWEQNISRFSEGQTVRGIIRSVESYGVFVELAPNLAGLAEYRDDVSVGSSAAVYIKSIIPEKMKIKLIIIDTSEAPKNRLPIEYFTDVSKVLHIDSWVYSPEKSKKVIESVF